MKKALVLPLVMAGQLIAGPALAQGSGKNVTIFHMSGPQLGVRLEEVDKDVVARLNLKEEKGALVAEVLKDSAAEKAGLRKDDVIVRLQGESVLTAGQLRRLVREQPSGRKVDIDVLRAGAPLKVTATLENGEWSREGMDMPDVGDMAERLNEGLGKLGDLKFKSDQRESPHTFNFRMDENDPAWTALTRGGKGRLGITYTEIDGQLAKYFKAPKDTAVLVNSVLEGSAAEKAGIKAGDLLVRLGGAAIAEGTQLQDAVRDLESGKATPVTVFREGRSIDLSVTLEAPQNSRIEAPRRRRPVS
ncbi:MAG: PDZ domain-containing protein [Vicinamibacteria bacterium]